MARWTHGWDELVTEVLDPAVCTSCAGCIIVCPKDVLVPSPVDGLPVLASEAHVDGDGRHCLHAAKGCTLCARVCPRFRPREEDLAEVSYWHGEDPLGPHDRIVLVKATDPAVAAVGQDGGLASALLIYALEHDYIDAALVSDVGENQHPSPRLARTPSEVLEAAGSRYTYSANTLAFSEADQDELPRLGLVSVGCQTSIPTVASIRGARKLARRFALTIGLLCSKTFTDDVYDTLLDGTHGVPRSTITKVNIKGRLQVWHDEGYLEVPLKECAPFTRPGCTTCPDFAARHADLSLGGIGSHDRTTLTLIRTELGGELIDAMERDGLIEVRNATEDDPGAIDLIRKLAGRQQARFPAEIVPGGASV